MLKTVLPSPDFLFIRTRKHGWFAFISVVVFLFEPSFVFSIEKLEGQAGFRMASLRWSAPHHLKGPLTFRVRYCELHPWGLHRCRYQTVDETSARTGRQAQETSQGVTATQEEEENFVVDIGGLRMSTNYSFQVVPQEILQKFEKPSQISLQTKGFSAKATKCLADSSEVVVETGPFFGGRISVEDSFTPGCYVKGNSQSPQTKYNLRIRHKECGSVIDGSKVTSVIVVQENIPILTHSTRRFVVVCSFSPDSFVVKAGVTLPRETSVAKSLDFNRIIRFAPQSSNSLNGEGDPENQQEIQLQVHHQHNSVPNHQQDGSYYVSRLYAEKRPIAESRSLDAKLHRGTWETFLVFGMICAAIVASMVSVIWFIRSYRSINEAHDETIRSITADDSSDTNSSISYDGSLSTTSNSSHVSPDLDSRSEMDVEVDFEFSEDINRQENGTASEVTLNISPQNFSCA